ncbi:CDK5 and ABL1 enzyme substrate 1 [Linnemannia zychae]|nr:CDK5 and ABL1 enzyme substrate 1 [Linnemannia zychae]
MRRRTGNRQAAFSFLSSIQLDPTATSDQDSSHPIAIDRVDEPNATIVNDTVVQEASPNVATVQNETFTPSIASTPIELKDITPAPTITQLVDNRRHVQGRKESMATTFLSQLSLHGDPSNSRSRDFSRIPQDASASQVSDVSPSQEPEKSLITEQSVLDADVSSQSLTSHFPVYRASSTPSLASEWKQGSFSDSFEPNDSQSSAAAAIGRGGEGRDRRQRKATNPGSYLLRASQQYDKRGVLSSTGSRTHLQRESSGLLSVLLARERDSDARPSTDTGMALMQRNAIQKVSSRWLGPLVEHVHIRPMLTSGTAHIVKKIFRRPSMSRSRHTCNSLSQSLNTQDSLSTSNPIPNGADLRMNSRQRRCGDDPRHIFYKGDDVTASCLSLGDNLSQHPYIFTTSHGSPLMVSSVLRYNDDRAPNKRRRRRFDREYIQQITKEALIRKKANSFAYLLTQSHSLDPDPQESSSSTYDPYYLDDPELKTGKNRTVISLACYMGSVIQYTRPSDLKRELNEHFRSRHPTIDPSITLSKIRKVKTDLLAISEELDLEISTVALAYAYFEKLILKGSWKGKEANPLSNESNTSVVTKENRKMIACVCLLLAYKANEPKRSSGEFATLMKHMTKHMEVSAKDIKENEFHVFSLLEFNLYLPRQEFLPHFEQILYRQDYLNVQEYLGEDEFYSIITQPRKAVE